MRKVCIPSALDREERRLLVELAYRALGHRFGRRAGGFRSSRAEAGRFVAGEDGVRSRDIMAGDGYRAAG
jgi:hypothetical protein